MIAWWLQVAVWGNTIAEHSLIYGQLIYKHGKLAWKSTMIMCVYSLIPIHAELSVCSKFWGSLLEVINS